MLSRWARDHRFRAEALASLLLLGAFCADAADAAEIRGRILPAPGLEMRSTRIDLIEIADDYQATVRELRGNSPVVEATTTPEDNGRFRIETTAQGIFAIEVRARGFLPMSHRLLPLVDTTELPDLRPLPAVRTSLHVIDRTGDGVEGVVVRYQPVLRTHSLQWGPAPQWHSTDRNGRVRPWRTPGVFKDRLWAGAPGYVPAFYSDESMPGRLRIERRRGRQRQLRLVDAAGRPLASVVARDQRGYARGISDDNGRLRLRLQPGEPITFIGPEGRRRIWALPVEPAPVEPQPASAAPGRPPLFVELTARRITGTVDSAGRAVAGAWVGLFDGVTHTYPLGTAVRTDEFGRYDLVVFGDWTTRVHARAPGFLPATANWEPDRPDTEGPRISLQPAARASGRVSDEAGNSIAEAHIGIRRRFEGSHLMRGARQESQTTSEHDGYFELLDLRAGRIYSGSVTASGLATAEFELMIDDSGQSGPVEVVLDLGLTVSGRVVDDRGSPIGQALVLLLPSRDRLGFWPPNDGPVLESREASSGENGRFAVEHLRAGRYDVVAQAPGFAPFSRYRYEVFEDGMELDDLELSSAVSLEGRVIDTRGRGIEEVRFYVGRQDEAVLRFLRHQRAARQPGAWQPPAGPQTLRTDEKGLFRIDDLSQGQRLDLDLQHPDYARLQVPGVVVPTGEPLVLELERKATLGGTVAESDGSPADLDLRLERGPNGSLLQLVYVRDGRFRIAGLGSGVYHFGGCERCTIVPSSILLEEAEVVVDLALVIYRDEQEIPRKASVRGRLLDANGIGVEGVVYVSRVGSNGSRGTPTDSGGAYRHDEIEAGLTEFNAARLGGARSLVRTVDLREGDNEVDLIIQGFELSGWVIGENDRPIVAARVRLDDRWLNSTPTDGNGRFSIRDVASGVHELRVTHEDWIDSVAQKVRVDSDRDDLEIRLRRGAVIRGRIVGLPQADLAVLEITAQGEGFVRGRVVGDGYEIRGVAPGDWNVRAVVERGGRQVSATTRVSGHGQDVDLDLEFGSGWLVGGSVLHNDRGLANLVVGLTGGDANQAAITRTDYRGAFVFQDLPSGEWQLTIFGQTGGVLLRETLRVDSDLDLGTIDIE